MCVSCQHGGTSVKILCRKACGPSTSGCQSLQRQSMAAKRSNLATGSKSLQSTTLQTFWSSGLLISSRGLICSSRSSLTSAGAVGAVIASEFLVQILPGANCNSQMPARALFFGFPRSGNFSYACSSVASLRARVQAHRHQYELELLSMLLL